MVLSEVNRSTRGSHSAAAASAIVGEAAVNRLPRKCDFVDSWMLLRRFGRDRQSALRSYKEFMAAGAGVTEDDLVKTIRLNNQGKRDMYNPGCWVIGDPEFVKSALAADKANRVRLAQYQIKGGTLPALGQAFCRNAGIEEEDLLRRSRGTRLSELRRVFSYLCRKEYGFPVAEIGRYLGIGSVPVSISVAKGAVLARKEPFLKILKKLRP